MQDMVCLLVGVRDKVYGKELIMDILEEHWDLDEVIVAAVRAFEKIFGDALRATDSPVDVVCSTSASLSNLGIMLSSYHKCKLGPYKKDKSYPGGISWIQKSDGESSFVCFENDPEGKNSDFRIEYHISVCETDVEYVVVFGVDEAKFTEKDFG